MSPPTYTTLLRAITLGTARRELPPTVGEWLDELAATDPTADDAEHLLAALGIQERVHRLTPPYSVQLEEQVTAPVEVTSPVSPRLARGLQLILEGTYPDLLDEATELVLQRQCHIPPPFLPALHLRAAALMDDDYARALRYVKAGGKRAEWLAEQHPDWQALSPNFDYAAAWKRESQPGEMSKLLSRWRRVDPEAARQALDNVWNNQSPRNQEVLLSGLAINLSTDDHAWLRAALPPKRKKVRRELARLLLLSGEQETTDDFREIARSLVSKNGDFTNVPTSERAKELLTDYGGVKAPQTPAQLLLELMPPDSWRELVDLPLPTFWLSLDPLQQRGAGRAVVAYPAVGIKVEFTRFLLFESPVKFPVDLAIELVRQLPVVSFDSLYDELLSKQKDALRLRGLPRAMAIGRRTPWSERLTKSMMTQLLENLRSHHLDYATQSELAQQWKQATPLLHLETFPWLRQQLHATTERYDAFGKLAVDMLQTTAFRRELHKP